MINGLGRFADATTGAVSTAPLAVVNVEQGKRYRFRLVSLACDPNFMFSIDGHTMTVIEADGVNTEPLTVDQIQIFAGKIFCRLNTALFEPERYTASTALFLHFECDPAR